jgi:hypothetical protein
MEWRVLGGCGAPPKSDDLMEWGKKLWILRHRGYLFALSSKSDLHLLLQVQDVCEATLIRPIQPIIESNSL